MENNKNYLISVCVVTQNNYKHMKLLLNSLFALYSSQEIEIIIIDNNSSDDTSKLINEFIVLSKIKIKYIHRERSFSLPENRNLAVKNANGNIIVLIDSDVEFIDLNFFDTVKSIFYDNSVFILSPLIIGRRDGLTQSLGLSRLFKMPYIFKFNFPNMKPEYVEKVTKNEIINIDMIHGACFIFRKSLLGKIGYFDEFMEPYNFDEMDFCIRASMNGFKLVATSKLKIIHYGGGTTNNFDKGIRARLFISHGFRSLIRNYKKRFLKGILIFLFFIATSYELFIETKNFKSFKIVTECLIWALQNQNNPIIK